MTLVLGDEHKRILSATGHVLVTGVPGSGKTTIALQKAIKYIDEKNLYHGQKVLFLSFSKAAVSRINESANLVIGDKNYQKLLSIQTFHSFFWEIMKTHSYLLGSPRRLCVLPPHDEKALQQGRNSNDKEWLSERENLFFKEGRTSFGLFAQIALRILKESNTICGIYSQKFPLIIIDEAQDTDDKQWQCIQKFASQCQMILLADLDQQIYDYRKDVTAERIADIKKELNPLQITLGNQNYRSSGTEVATFARDLLNNSPRAGSYNGISAIYYHPSADQRDKVIRQSIGRLSDSVTKYIGRKLESIAILATWGKGVNIISRALRGTEDQKAIPHKVQFDEATTYLSSRLIALLLEPGFDNNESNYIAQAIDIMCEFYQAKDNRSEWEKYKRWSSEIRSGSVSRQGKVVPEIKRIAKIINESNFSGIPEKDWLKVKELLLFSRSGAIKDIAKNSEHLMAFNMGRRISSGLAQKWQETGAYHNARSVLDSAIVENQIISDNKDHRGIHVMTIHKAKGKEFDGVIIFHNTHSSPFVWGENLTRNRRLLFVGATRARHHTMFLMDRIGTKDCPIMSSFNID